MSSLSGKKSNRIITAIEGDMKTPPLDEDMNKPGFPNQGTAAYHFYPNPALGFSENSAETYTVNHVAEAWGASIDPDRTGGMYVVSDPVIGFRPKRNCAQIIPCLYISQDAWMVDPGTADDDFQSLWKTESHFARAAFDARLGTISVGDTVEWNGVGGGNFGTVLGIRYITASTGVIDIRKVTGASTAQPIDNDVVALDASNTVTLSEDAVETEFVSRFYWKHVQYGSGTYAQGTQKASRNGLWLRNDRDIVLLVEKNSDSGYAMTNTIYRQLRADDYDPDVHLKNS